ncbi:MAG: hypothetical protein IJ639_02410, partial [Ruminococcus sp.]|nr:hypothetical protein [Ruminococcus sp.]
SGMEKESAISTYGLTPDQSHIIRELCELFRKQNELSQKHLAEKQYEIIGKIVTEFKREE